MALLEYWSMTPYRSDGMRFSLCELLGHCQIFRWLQSCTSSTLLFTAPSFACLVVLMYLRCSIRGRPFTTGAACGLSYSPIASSCRAGCWRLCAANMCQPDVPKPLLRRLKRDLSISLIMAADETTTTAQG